MTMASSMNAMLDFSVEYQLTSSEMYHHVFQKCDSTKGRRE